MAIFQIRIRLLLCISVVVLLTATTTNAQDGHNLYIGAQYSVPIQIKERPERECNNNNPATGLCPVLHYDVVRVPLVDLGYFYLKNLKSYPAYGLHFGVNYKSHFQNRRVIKDDNFYEFYSQHGIYPDKGLTRYSFHSVFINGGLNYSNNNIFILTGLGLEAISRTSVRFFSGTKDRYTNYFDALDVYLKFGYKFNKTWSAYFSFQTTTRKEDYSRTCDLSLGINYTLK